MTVVSAVHDVAIAPCMAESPRVSWNDSCERCPRYGRHDMCMAKSPRVSRHDSCEHSHGRGYYAKHGRESRGKSL